MAKASAASNGKIETPEPTYERWFTDITTVMLMTPQSNPGNQTCGWGQPVMFWGGSGIGKSDQIRQAGAHTGLPYEVLFPGQRQPEDFSGVLTPNPNSPEGVSIQCLLPAVRRLNRLGKGLLHVDEATNAPPAVQGAMLGMLLDRLVGDEPLAPQIRILLSGNPPDISAGGYGFEPPTANRLAHFKLGQPTWETWNTWYMTEENEIQATQTFSEALVTAAWPDVYPTVKGFISGFLQAHNAALYDQPNPRDPRGGFQWPSPRTWVKAGRCLATRQALGLPEELDDILVGGLVGHGLAMEFATWRREANLPTPEDVLNGKWKVNRDRLDVAHAVVGTLVAYVGMKRNQDDRTNTAVKVWKVFDQMIDAQLADLLPDSIKIMINNYGLGVSGNSPEPVVQAARPVLSKTGRLGMQNYL